MKGLCQKCFSSNEELVIVHGIPLCNKCNAPVKKQLCTQCNDNPPVNYKCTKCGVVG